MREQTENETLLEYCMKCLPDFTFENGLLKKENEKGIMELSNFLPIPLEEVQYDNGEDVQRSFKIMALKLHNGEVIDLPAATVKSDDLAGMGWMVDNWGFRANIYPPQNSRKDYLRYVLFELGTEMAKSRTVYTHTGWRQIGGRMVLPLPRGSDWRAGSVCGTGQPPGAIPDEGTASSHHRGSSGDGDEADAADKAGDHVPYGGFGVLVPAE